MDTHIDTSQHRRAASVRTLRGWRTPSTARSAAAALSLSIVLGYGCAIAASQSEPEPHDPVRSVMIGQPLAALQQIYLVCARNSVAGRLGSAEITACSIAYDVLLKQHFNDDFAALLNWSRAVQDKPVACADTDCGVRGTDE
ncbi:MAG: hypothetical protein ABJB17_09980 [Burkholderiales bacterium]